MRENRRNTPVDHVTIYADERIDLPSWTARKS